MVDVLISGVSFWAVGWGYQVWVHVEDNDEGIPLSLKIWGSKSTPFYVGIRMEFDTNSKFNV